VVGLDQSLFDLPRTHRAREKTLLLTADRDYAFSPDGDSDPLATLQTRIDDRTARVGIVGLGYVGLPLAVEFGAQFPVVGFDSDARRVREIMRGKSPILDVADHRLEDLLGQGQFSATGDFSQMRDCDVLVICVPTPLGKNKEPDLSYVKSAANAIVANLRPGQLVVLESTTYPGTTDEMLLPLLSSRGMKIDRDFLLAFSPERVDPGNKQFNITEIPKVVGGCSELSTEVAASFYGSVIHSVHPVSTARVAEMSKLLENTFRLVNIGLANEMALLARHLHINSHEAIEAAATKPFGFMPFYPGPGVGGHCIPLDPQYLSWKAKREGFDARFITLAEDVNAAMPKRIVEMVANALNDDKKALNGSRVLILGAAYKSDTDDTRHSPAIAILDLLRDRHAEVVYHDPLVERLDIDLSEWAEWRAVKAPPAVDRRNPHVRTLSGEIPARRRYDSLTSVELTASQLERADCVVIVTAHEDVDYRLVLEHAKIVVDTRAAISPAQRAGAKARVIAL